MNILDQIGVFKDSSDEFRVRCYVSALMSLLIAAAASSAVADVGCVGCCS